MKDTHTLHINDWSIWCSIVAFAGKDSMRNAKNSMRDAEEKYERCGKTV